MTAAHDGAIAFGSGDQHHGSVVLKTKFVLYGYQLRHSLYLWSILVVVLTTDRLYFYIIYV